MDPCSSTKCSTDIIMLHNVLFGIEWHTCISVLFKYSKMSRFDFINVSNQTTYRYFCSIQRHLALTARPIISLVGLQFTPCPFPLPGVYNRAPPLTVRFRGPFPQQSVRGCTGRGRAPPRRTRFLWRADGPVDCRSTRGACRARPTTRSRC